MYYKISGVNSLVIYFGESISDDTFKQVNTIYQFLKEKNLDGICELVPSYTTLYAEFDIFQFTHEELFQEIENLIKNTKFNQESLISREIEIPVFYDTEVGLDLARVAEHNNLTIDEVISLHSQQTYTVYIMGFAPAFGFMGKVDNKIATPRLESPRKKVPKNSVAIADNQTSIYPNESPGGWNILGRTYLNIFDKSCENFSYIKAGDKVQFLPITKEEFLRHGGEL